MSTPSVMNNLSGKSGLRTKRATKPIGGLLRTWRERRRLSQLELAGAADISARHMSFLETGRSIPSRAMLLRLAERLEIPLRERNSLLLSAGYAPMYTERRLDDPALEQAHKALRLVIEGHSPYPALAVDRHWTLVASNSALAPLLTGVDPRLLEPPVNVLRLGLHPQGVAPRVANYTQWRTNTLTRLRQQIAATADPILVELLAELESYPLVSTPETESKFDDADFGGVMVPLRLRTDYGLLSFFSTTTVFGTPLDITLSELAIESFFPADAQTAEILARMARKAEAARGTSPHGEPVAVLA